MKFILLSISLVIMTGCFFNSDTPNSDTSKENTVIEKDNNSSTSNISRKNIKTYTREELLQRKKSSTPDYSTSDCKSYSYIDEKLNDSTESPDTITSPIEYKKEEDCSTPIYSTYTEEDFVSSDVVPIQNNMVEQSELKEYIDRYLEQLQTLNTDGIVSMTYPEFFKPINENLFRKYINTILSSSQISVESFKTNLLYLGDVYPYDDGEFAQIIYQSNITLNFLNPELYNDELSIRVLNNVLVGKYGQENIKINPAQRSINIKKEEKLLAIKKKDEEWKFIGDNPAYRRYYPTVLPKSILSQI